MRARVRMTMGSAAAFLAGVLLLNPLGAVSRAADKPDLAVTAIGSPPATALPGDTFNVSVTVANVGLGAALPTASVTSVVTKFYLVAGSTKKNLKFVQTVPLPFDAGATQTDDVTLGIYSDTVPGTYDLQGCAEGNGDISESNESNNCKTAAERIVVQDVPDLIISSLSNPPSAGALGQSITVKDTVKNVGKVAADPTVTKYYLISTIDGTRASDLKLPSPNVPTPVLKSGQTYTEQQTVFIRTDVEPGTYRLQACANASGVEAERDENNNCLTTNGIITVSAVPDLVVTSVDVAGAPLTALPNDTLSIIAVVRNDGDAKATRSSTLKFTLVNTATGAEKNLNGTATVPTLDARTEITVPASAKVYSDTASGVYTVRVCADSGKAVAELLESNNCADAAGTVTVQGIVQSSGDLVVTDVPNPPAHALPGAPLTLTATVRNQGSEAAPATVTTFYLVNTSSGARKNVKNPAGTSGLATPALAPDGEVTPPAASFSVYGDTAAGTYVLQACADALKALSEAIESNNCANSVATITIDQSPNLVITSIANPPATAPLGSSIKVTTGVKNTGQAVAGASTTKYYLVSTTDGTLTDLKGPATTPNVAALNPGQTINDVETLTIRATSPPTATGTYRLRACADGKKDVVESNEDDNCLTSSGTIKVTGLPDLTVTAVSVKDPLTVARGGSLSITTTVKNVGEGDAVATTTKFLLVSTVVNPDGTRNAKNLNGTVGAPLLHGNNVFTVAKTATVFNDTPLGTYTVQACADGLDVVQEGSETNNCLETSSIVTIQ